ncbi:uncharacterized protein LOC18424266 [Amborella trichopoda]|uniref:uncharacterized protein LOC18424266 n=1 Tax=Amborella trichopoda TaxID=13333 RepID=UPI0005D2D5BB|nr:uncharacterized protein LOC18424266 [Amborella trichopoda]|eukprot:XP_011628952.1 uncharacterized protein LOC18424266 [Amborella trichopoda]
MALLRLLPSLLSTLSHHPPPPPFFVSPSPPTFRLTSLSLSSASSIPSLSLSSPSLPCLSSHEPQDDAFLGQFQLHENEDDTLSPLQPQQQVKGRLETLRGSHGHGALLQLSIKEKKELASYAHSLGKKLKSQQVGKSGVTPAVAASFIETLEANEVLKLKIHGSCPGELNDVIKQLEESTGSVAIGQIGRAVILYRPSLSKLKAAEKKHQDKITRRGRILKASDSSEKSWSRKFHSEPRTVPKLSGRGRRGSSRFISTF